MSALLTGLMLPWGILIDGSARPSIRTIMLLPSASPLMTMGPKFVPFIRPS